MTLDISLAATKACRCRWSPTRAFRLPKDVPVQSFEVDAPKTRAVKREVLAREGVDSAGITFVAADFEKEDWLTRLVDAGFDLGTPALFLWEGVMVYLDKEAVEATLRKIAGTAKGSVVAFDCFTTNCDGAAEVSAASGYSDAAVYHGVILSRLLQIEGDLQAAARELQEAVDRMQVDAPAQAGRRHRAGVIERARLCRRLTVTSAPPPPRQVIVV